MFEAISRSQGSITQLPVSEAGGHLGLRLHLPEGEGQVGQDAQAGDRGAHQVIRDPRVVIITEVAPETFHDYLFTTLNFRSYLATRNIVH